MMSVRTYVGYHTTGICVWMIRFVCFLPSYYHRLHSHLLLLFFIVVVIIMPHDTIDVIISHSTGRQCIRRRTIVFVRATIKELSGIVPKQFEYKFGLFLHRDQQCGPQTRSHHDCRQRSRTIGKDVVGHS